MWVEEWVSSCCISEKELPGLQPEDFSVYWAGEGTFQYAPWLLKYRDGNSSQLYLIRDLQGKKLQTRTETAWPLRTTFSVNSTISECRSTVICGHFQEARLQPWACLIVLKYVKRTYQNVWHVMGRDNLGMLEGKENMDSEQALNKSEDGWSI
ncbi:hypothetical protein lerEdw1_010221 [Lerista edwardsae]|nr:hypothetical protein lerEdw1_010221 [Lerista edwardsae]